jgi:hypothetical protein
VFRTTFLTYQKNFFVRLGFLKNSFNSGCAHHGLVHEGDFDEAHGAASLEAHAVGEADVAVAASAPAEQEEKCAKKMAPTNQSIMSIFTSFIMLNGKKRKINFSTQ